MAAMIEPRKDDKMDTLNAKVGDVDVRLTRVEVKVDALGASMDRGRKETRAGFENLNGRLERMQRTMLWAAVTLIVALLGSGSVIVAALIGLSHP